MSYNPLLQHFWSRRSTPSPLSILLLATLLFQATVRGQTNEDDENFDKGVKEIYLPLIQGSQNLDKETKDSIPVTEDNNENYEQGVGEIFPPPPSGDCTCVPFYLCKNNTNILNEDGEGVIDIRIQGACSDYTQKCCVSIKDKNEVTRIPTKDTRTNCGHWNPSGVGFRIIGDTNNEAQFGEFPWMVAILKKEVPKPTYHCGASLIHPKVVMTALHCVVDKEPEDLVIRAGEWDSKTENELLPHQDGEVFKIIKHERYYGAAVHNDIALIILTHPFVLTENVGTICLPPHGYKFETERCYASGWGKNATTGGRANYQNILKKIDLPIVPRSPCIKLLRETRLGQKFKLHESFICAGGELGKDTCKGDGGSPLMCPITTNSHQFQQAGMVAWGIGCGDVTPGVYVDVAQFRDWIDRHMNDNGLDTSYYDADFDVSTLPSVSN